MPRTCNLLRLVMKPNHEKSGKGKPVIVKEEVAKSQLCYTLSNILLEVIYCNYGFDLNIRDAS